MLKKIVASKQMKASKIKTSKNKNSKIKTSKIKASKIKTSKNQNLKNQSLQNQNLKNENLDQLVYNKSNTILIGIHSRRGDYTDKSNVDFGYIAAEFDYFRTAIYFSRQKHYFEDKNILFLMLGDDYKWNLENFGNFSDVLVLKPNWDEFFDFEFFCEL